MHPYKKILLATVAAGAVAASSSAFAQGDGIEIVTVTAAKREQNVQDVPISMNVVSQAQLEKFNTSDLKEMSASIPSMVIYRSPANVGIVLRGFGSGPSNPAFDQTVSLYQDGVYAGRARQFMAPFFDVERVEVLRGPQGALLGKNTAAGAISIVSANPTDEFEGKATVSYLVNRQGYDAFGHVSGPITDDLSARLAVKFSSQDGWVKNLATGRNDPRSDNKLGRLTLRWQPTEGIDNTTKFEYQSFSANGRAAAQFNAALPLAQTLTARRNTPGPFGVEEFDKQNGYNFSNTANFDLGDVTLTSVSGFSAFKSASLGSGGNGNPETFGTAFTERFNQGSQEFRVTSPTGQTIEWIAGVYADYSAYDMRNVVRYIILGGLVNGQATLNYRQNSFTYSAYGTATWNITDELRLIGNARWTQIGKSGRYVQTLDFGGALPGAGPRTIVDKLREDHFDPSLTVQYDVVPEIKTYASYSRGSKGGTFDPSSRTVVAANFKLRPERSENFEIGAKTNVFDWLTFNLSAYLLKFKDLQVAAYDPTVGSLATKNAGRARSEGIELVAEARVAEGLTLAVTGQYMDAYYEDFPGATCTYAQTTPPRVPPCVPATNNIGGYRLPYSSKWSGQFRADYTQPVGDDLKIGLTGTVDFRSSMVIDAATYNPFFGIQQGFAKYNARVELADIEDRWSIAFVGKNLTDELTSSNAFLWPFSVPPSAGEQIDETRSIAIQATLKF